MTHKVPVEILLEYIWYHGNKNTIKYCMTINSPSPAPLGVADIKKIIKCDVLVLHSQLSAIDNIILIFQEGVRHVVKWLYCPLTPAEGGNELWMALVIYGPIILEIPTRWLCCCSSLCYWETVCFSHISSGYEWVNDCQQIGMWWISYLTLDLKFHLKDTQAAHTHTQLHTGWLLR